MPKLEGPDVSIKISLKEYGIAWKIGETETRFYYGIKHDDSEYVSFDWVDLENNLDMHKEYDWANFKALSEFTGIPQKDWEKIPLIGKIQDLNSYYGHENIFGSSYTEPITYEEVIEDAGE